MAERLLMVRSSRRATPHAGMVSRYQSSRANKLSGFRWVYRFSICMLRWPVIEATSIGCRPFSNNRDAASCRRSCQRSVLISGASRAACWSTRFQIHKTALVVVRKTRPVSFSSTTSHGPNRDRSNLASEPSAMAPRCRNTATARRESGKTAGTPLLSVPRASGGTVAFG